MKILFYIGKIKRDLFEGEVVKKAGNYLQIKIYKEDGTWFFKWFDKVDVNIVYEFESEK